METFRQERKYIIGIADYVRLKPMLMACLDFDAHNGPKGAYTVSSLYFDSYGDSDLQDVLDGLLSKQKVRLRLYPPNRYAGKLEFKCKTDTDSVKRSIPLSYLEMRQMAAADYGFLPGRSEETARELYARLKGGVYLPRVTVEYERTAHIRTGNEIRITFDHNLRASFVRDAIWNENAAFEPIMPRDVGILEVKYNGFLFGYIKDALAFLQESSRSNSKYVNARLLL